MQFWLPFKVLVVYDHFSKRGILSLFCSTAGWEPLTYRHDVNLHCSNAPVGNFLNTHCYLH